MNLKKKTEKVFRAYLRQMTKTGKIWAGVNLEEGHNDLDFKLPAIEVWAGSSREREDIPPHSGEFDVDLEVRLYTQADDENRELEDERIEGIVNEMLDIVSLQAFANYPTARRAVPQYMIQDCYEQGRDSSSDERCFLETMQFKVVCRNDNGQGSS